MKKSITLLIMSAMLMTAVLGFAKKKYVTQEKTVLDQITEEREIIVDMEISLVELNVARASDDVAYHVNILYDKDYFDPLVSYKIRGDQGFLQLTSETFDIDDFGGIGDLFNRKHYKENQHPHKWDVQLTDRLPLEINAEIAMGEAEFDLSELQVRDLRLEAGMAEVGITFDTPNPITMERMDIEAGLGELNIEGLGNASLKKMKLEVGLGEATVDFSGDSNQDFRATMEVGLGELELRLPKDLPVIINCECSFLSSVDFDDFREIRDDVYVSPNYDDSKDCVQLDISVGLGSAEVIWID